MLRSQFLNPATRPWRGIMFSCWRSVCLSIRPSFRNSFPFGNFSIYKRISFKFCICICTKNASLGNGNGQISIIYHSVMALVNVQKWFLASSSFTIYRIMMKLHKNYRSNKSSI